MSSQKIYKSILVFFLFPLFTFSQEKPKLVVGIVVDMMRFEAIDKYWDKYSDGGFKRLVNKGYQYAEANYNFAPTYTGPGHACIFTGTTPSVNGIVSNEWYDRDTGKEVYCVADSSVNPIGTTSSAAKMSPANLLSPTITDNLRKADRNSKVICLSLKDRSAILPGGHLATAAYWYDKNSEGWVSSSYYMKDLPLWVKKFNARRLPDSLLKTSWTTLLPVGQYTESIADDNPYESPYSGETNPVFPHNLPAISQTDRDMLHKTPFGNTFTEMFAESALMEEHLGSSGHTDFLVISFSSTDYVGHQFGLQSIEAEDTYLRLDLDIARLLNFLDLQMGQDNYLVFLTADHGAADNPEYASAHQQEGGFFNPGKMIDSMKTYLNSTYRPDQYFLHANAHEIYLNSNLVAITEVGTGQISDSLCKIAKHFEGVASAVSAYDFSRNSYSEGIESFIQRGYYPGRSADIRIELKPGWLEAGSKTGTTHGSPYGYDTHVPLIFYGWKIPQGKSERAVTITDVAPTLSALLHISIPSGSTGKPLKEILKMD